MDAQSLEAVYNKGRSDAASEFQDLIPAIGAQVYGEASRRIEENIRESAEKEKELVNIPVFIGKCNHGVWYFPLWVGCCGDDEDRRDLCGRKESLHERVQGAEVMPIC